MKNGFLTGFLLAAAIVAGIFWFFSASFHNQMMRDGSMMGGHMMKSGTSKPSDSATITVPELTAIEKDGEALFNDNCAVCHGDNATGRDGAGPPLIHKIYEPNHHSDMAFVLAAKNGVRQHHWRFGNMPPIKTVNDADVQKIVTYVRRLQRANGIN